MTEFPEVVFYDENSKRLPLWGVHAGMTVVGTEYRNGDGSLHLTVGPPTTPPTTVPGRTA